MKFYEGSPGAALHRAVVDPKFRALAKAFAETRETLFRELAQTETGHYDLSKSVRCTEASWLDAKWKNHPGYLSAWFSLQSYNVHLYFLGSASELTATLDAFEARHGFYENGEQYHIPRVADEGYGRDMIDELGFTWSAKNPMFWKALALVKATPHPQLCGSCHAARISGLTGRPCSCADAGVVSIHRSVT